MKLQKLVYFFILPVLIFFIFIPLEGRMNETQKTKANEPAKFDIEALEKSLDGVADIGAGRNFLTLMANLPQRLPNDYRLFALALDKDEVPIRKISSFMYDPEIKDKNHIWFYFFLFVPGGQRHELRREPLPPSGHNYVGDYLKFILVKGNETVMEKIIPRFDEWGNDTTPLFLDIPAPPQEIPGYLELRDYTFFAQDDYRKPEGYFIEGKIIGGAGSWNYFEPTSGILGQEPEPKVKLVTSQGWIELKTGKTHQQNEAVAPISPYVNGWWDGKGFFHPDPLKIIL
ncbi:MAG: hypothetical protein MUF15_03390 [Acidobacteria bacterium]|jgi:hypothetical protein|nr:hypothetical protein [Acidobacteriota bacterium]